MYVVFATCEKRTGKGTFLPHQASVSVNDESCNRDDLEDAPKSPNYASVSLPRRGSHCPPGMGCLGDDAGRLQDVDSPVGDKMSVGAMITTTATVQRVALRR